LQEEIESYVVGMAEEPFGMASLLAGEGVVKRNEKGRKN
jgi:hypothetical protein